MKARTIIAAAVVAAVASLSFAESYTVSSVKGTVKAGTAAVKAGQKLDGAEKVSAGLNSALTLTDAAGKTIVIKGKTSGTLAELAAKASGGLRRGSLNTTTVAAANGGSKGVATASSRASEAKEDTDWAE